MNYRVNHVYSLIEDATRKDDSDRLTANDLCMIIDATDSIARSLPVPPLKERASEFFSYILSEYRESWLTKADL